jgi:hypothetical protein
MKVKESREAIFFFRETGVHPPVNILKPSIQATSFRVFTALSICKPYPSDKTHGLRTPSFKTTTLQTTKGREATEANSRRHGRGQP